MPRRQWSTFGSILGIAVVYFLAGKLGLKLAFVHPSASPVWPDTGIAFAALLIFGVRIWPAIFISAWLVNFTTAGSPLTSVAIAAGNTLEGVLGALLVNRFADGRQAFDSPSGIFKFMIFGCIISPAVSATFGASSLMLGGFAGQANYASLWLTWWLGDMVGAILVTPVILFWAREPWLTWPRRKVAESALFILSIIFVSLFIFDYDQRYPRAFLGIPLIVGAAFRLGQTGTATLTLLLAAMAIWQHVTGGDVIAGESANAALLVLQAFMGTTALTGLMIAAVVAEGVKTEKDLKESRERLADLNQNLEKEVAVRTHELMKKEEELFQAQKLEAIGKLAGGVAHDFNNLITGILGVSEDLKSTFDPGDQRREEMDEIIKASKRAFAVTKQLLAFGRRQIAQPRVIDINIIVMEVNKFLQRLIGEDIQLQLQLGDISNVKMDPVHIEQILLNLATNARDAMPDGGRIRIRTTEAEVKEARGAQILGVPPGRYVLIEVADNGVGMDEKTLAHIFEPFFTTKSLGKGTGLGLPTVYGIVKQANGGLEVESAPGAGSKFRIYIPVSLEKTDKAAAASSSLRNGKETILVVEDETIVRHVVVKKLRKLGYTVIEAANGEEGLKIALTQKDCIDLVLTDVVMPGMNGREMVDKLHRHCPKAAVVFMSGYPEDIIASRGVVDSSVNFIDKSDLTAELPMHVRRVLDKRRA